MKHPVYSYCKGARRNAKMPVNLFVKFPLCLYNFIKTWNVLFTVREALSIQLCIVLSNGCPDGICGRTIIFKLKGKSLQIFFVNVAKSRK